MLNFCTVFAVDNASDLFWSMWTKGAAENWNWFITWSRYDQRELSMGRCILLIERAAFWLWSRPLSCPPTMSAKENSQHEAECLLWRIGLSGFPCWNLLLSFRWKEATTLRRINSSGYRTIYASRKFTTQRFLLSIRGSDALVTSKLEVVAQSFMPSVVIMKLPL